MTDVFLSYAREDKGKAEKIAKALDAVPLAVWWDREIQAGANFTDEIEKKIGEARYVLVMWSGPARNSLYVKGEALEALDQKKLVQVMLDGSKIPVPFNAVHTLFLKNWDGDVNSDTWKDLIRKLSDGVVEEDKVGRNVLRAGVSGSQTALLWLTPILAAMPLVAGAGALWATANDLIETQHIAPFYIAVGLASVAPLVALMVLLAGTALAAFKEG